MSALSTRAIAVLLLHTLIIGNSYLSAAELEAGSAASANQELAAIEDAIGQIQSWLQSANARLSAEESAVREAHRALDRQTAIAITSRQQLFSLREELAIIQQRQDSLEAEITASKETLVQALQASYRAGDTSELKLLMNLENITENARMQEYLRRINLALAEKIASHQRLLDDSANNIAVLTRQETIEQQKQSELTTQLEQLNRAQAEKDLALINLRDSIASKGSELVELEQNRRQLEALIEEINDAIIDIPTPADQAPFAEMRGKLPRPMNREIVSSFASDYGNGRLQRQGVVFASSRGEEVKAVHGGRVVFADWLRGSGLVIILDHGDNYLSLYGANETLTRRAGEWVSAGDVIATAGNNQDQSGLYFEIRRDGTPINPSPWWQ